MSRARCIRPETPAESVSLGLLHTTHSRTKTTPQLACCSIPTSPTIRIILEHANTPREDVFRLRGGPLTTLVQRTCGAVRLLEDAEPGPGAGDEFYLSFGSRS